MLRIVTDSAGDMPQAWRKEFDVHFVPVNVFFGTEQYLHGVNISEDDFYKRVETVTEKTFPKTSQPNPHQFEQAYRQLAQKGDTILSIHVTGKLSKTVESARLAAEAVKDDYKVLVVDSLCGSMGMGYLCRTARQLERAGHSPEAIVTRLEQIAPRISFAITLATLKYAQMSGRVGGLRGMLGMLLNLKPIIELKDGVLLPTEDKIRVRSKAFDRLVEITKANVGDQRVCLSVVHASAPDEAATLAALASPHFKLAEEVVISPLSVAVAVQLGPGTVGLIAYPAD